MINLVIVGASGFGRELYQYFQDAHGSDPGLCVKGFLDDDESRQHEWEAPHGTKVIGNTSSYEAEPHDRFLISPGDPQIRDMLASRLADRGSEFFTLIHPTAYVAPTARIEPGCIVGPFANVGSYAELGSHVLLNLYSAVGHDTRIGSCSVFSPYAVANGGSIIGRKIFMGSHAVVTPNTKVGDQCKIAAGAVAYHDVPDNSLAAGNPAKPVSLKSSGSQTGSRKSLLA